MDLPKMVEDLFGELQEMKSFYGKVTIGEIVKVRFLVLNQCAYLCEELGTFLSIMGFETSQRILLWRVQGCLTKEYSLSKNYSSCFGQMLNGAKSF